MPRYQLSRRELIEKCAALGVVVTATILPISAIAKIWDESEVHHATPPNAFGPFYKKHSPQGRELRVAGDTGLPLTVTGRVLDTRGEALEDAKVEVWHADHFGKYDIEGYRRMPARTLSGQRAGAQDAGDAAVFCDRPCI